MNIIGSALTAAFRVYETIKAADPRYRVRNQESRTKEERNGLPVPPADLLFAVAGSPRIEVFLDGGEKAAVSIRLALARGEMSVERSLPLLDFGCGCGRAIRHWQGLPNGSVYGTDYNPRLVEWCTRNLPFGNFSTNRLLPPLAYDDNQFGLVYALSVFTHLPEEAGRAWLKELSRVLRPGGYLLISTHGDGCLSRLTRQEREMFERGQLVEKFSSAAGSNLCCVYHPARYVRETLARGWELADFEPRGALGNPPQDMILLKKTLKPDA